jgi:hypothetical protein
LYDGFGVGRGVGVGVAVALTTGLAEACVAGTLAGGKDEVATGIPRPASLPGAAEVPHAAANGSATATTINLCTVARFIAAH